jgi:hypothetical protein
MEIELINTKDMTTINKEVDYSMVSIRHMGYDYVIFADPKRKDRLYLDVYRGKAAEGTSYNGILPKKRSIIDHLRNKFIDYKTRLYNVTLNRKAIKQLKEKLNKI